MSSVRFSGVLRLVVCVMAACVGGAGAARAQSAAPDNTGELRLVYVADSAPIPVPVIATRLYVASPALQEVKSALRVTVDDTLPKKRARLVAYSDWYGRRLAIHRTLSWAMIPLFAASYVTGDRLLKDGRENSPDWVRNVHPVAAGGSAVVFGVNTVTGLWNLWDSRRDPNGRTRRLIHAGLLLAADAGFVYTGSLGDEARENGAIRRRHRTFAISSMAVSTASWVYMLVTR
jgi:hypothetical protein